jgi:hypothetical protein
MDRVEAGALTAIVGLIVAASQIAREHPSFLLVALGLGFVLAGLLVISEQGATR